MIECTWHAFNNLPVKSLERITKVIDNNIPDDWSFSTSGQQSEITFNVGGKLGYIVLNQSFENANDETINTKIITGHIIGTRRANGNINTFGSFRSTRTERRNIMNINPYAAGSYAYGYGVPNAHIQGNSLFVRQGQWYTTTPDVLTTQHDWIIYIQMARMSRKEISKQKQWFRITESKIEIVKELPENAVSKRRIILSK